jgi:hypothetical protein
LGVAKSVDVTVDGRPVDLFGTGSTAAITKTAVAVDQGVIIARPLPLAVVGPTVRIVVGVPTGTRTADWFVISAESDQVLFQGAVPGLTNASPGFGFTLDLPAGSYRLEVQTTGAPGGDEAAQSEFTVR